MSNAINIWDISVPDEAHDMFLSLVQSLCDQYKEDSTDLQINAWFSDNDTIILETVGFSKLFILTSREFINKFYEQLIAIPYKFKINDNDLTKPYITNTKRKSTDDCKNRSFTINADKYMNDTKVLSFILQKMDFDDIYIDFANFFHIWFPCYINSDTSKFHFINWLNYIAGFIQDPELLNHVYVNKNTYSLGPGISSYRILDILDNIDKIDVDYSKYKMNPDRTHVYTMKVDYSKP